MRCYVVVDHAGPGGARRVHKFIGTQGEAPGVKRELSEELGLGVRSFLVEDVEVPLAKADLLGFLNQMLKGKI